MCKISLCKYFIHNQDGLYTIKSQRQYFMILCHSALRHIPNFMDFLGRSDMKLFIVVF